jgi:hypothetical protein
MFHRSVSLGRGERDAASRAHRRASILTERLRAAGRPMCRESAPLDFVAGVLAEIHGDPTGLMEGEPLPSTS